MCTGLYCTVLYCKSGVIMCTGCCMLNIASLYCRHCVLLSMHCVLYTVLCVLCSKHCILCTVWCVLFIVCCVQCAVNCAMYIVYSSSGLRKRFRVILHNCWVEVIFSSPSSTCCWVNRRKAITLQFWETIQSFYFLKQFFWQINFLCCFSGQSGTRVLA